MSSGAHAPACEPGIQGHAVGLGAIEPANFEAHAPDRRASRNDGDAEKLTPCRSASSASGSSLKAWMEKYLSASVHTFTGDQPTPRASAVSDSTLYL